MYLKKTCILALWPIILKPKMHTKISPTFLLWDSSMDAPTLGNMSSLPFLFPSYCPIWAGNGEGMP